MVQKVVAMTDKQPLALRLADEFDRHYAHTWYKNNVFSWGEDASAALRRLNEDLDAAKTMLQSRSEQIKSITHLVTKLHQAKGRYHTQMALCALFDAFGLPNVKPESRVK